MKIDMVSDAVGRAELRLPAGQKTPAADAFTTGTRADGFTAARTERFPFSDGGAVHRTELVETGGSRKLTLIERFRPTGAGVRWETEVWSDAAEPFSVPLRFGLQFDGRRWPTYWTAWADPRTERENAAGDAGNIANADSSAIINNRYTWTDPLVPRSLETRRFWYGAPYYEPDRPRIGYSPFFNDLVCIPLAAVYNDDAGCGVTFALSPEDTLLDLVLDVSDEGAIQFTRLFHRLEAGRPATFAADVVVHEHDWRGSLRWMTERYPGYFHPALPEAADIAGTSAYSSSERPFDADALRGMAFKVNWKASFDFPYMGMFLPDVPEDKQWMSYGNTPTSIRQLRDYSVRMRAEGFHVLNYFNVTEFGADVRFPLPAADEPDPDEPLWKDCSRFLDRHLREAVLLKPSGEPYFTWGRAVAMDPGEPGYQRFLLEQASRHLELLPESSGLCVDRLDWTRLYNRNGDDGVSWCERLPCRSMQQSWQQIMRLLGELLHRHGKALFCNNHTKRLDQLLLVDGIFDEFTYAATALNTSAFLGVFKPVLGWVTHKGQVLYDIHDFFQRYLYMGVFPMAPFPGNDHAMLPDPETDRAYLAYGPLLERLRGKKWVLAPFPVSVGDNSALANVFEVPGAYVVPVVYATGERVRLTLRLPGLVLEDARIRCEAVCPGSGDRAEPLMHTRQGGALLVETPVRHGCAVVTIAFASGS